MIVKDLTSKRLDYLRFRSFGGLRHWLTIGINNRGGCLKISWLHLLWFC